MESTAPVRCEIARLPDDLLSATLARTGPRDACRAAAVSPAFRAAADADAVWSSFLPRDLPPLADGELPADPQSTKKQLFMRLSDPGSPVLLADGLTSMWLDRATGAKCYMLSARNLGIVWGDTPQYWRWIPLTVSRFSEAAELLDVCWLEINGKIHCKMLSHNTTYAAYMVFKMSDRSYGLDLDYPPQRAAVSTGVTKSTRRVCLQVYDNEGEDHRVPPELHVHHPQTRADGWMEMQMGEFKNEEGEDGEVYLSLTGRGGHWKRGLIVQGIEIRTLPYIRELVGRSFYHEVDHPVYKVEEETPWLEFPPPSSGPATTRTSSHGAYRCNAPSTTTCSYSECRGRSGGAIKFALKKLFQTFCCKAKKDDSRLRRLEEHYQFDPLESPLSHFRQFEDPFEEEYEQLHASARASASEGAGPSSGPHGKKKAPASFDSC